MGESVKTEERNKGIIMAENSKEGVETLCWVIIIRLLEWEVLLGAPNSIVSVPSIVNEMAKISFT